MSALAELAVFVVSFCDRRSENSGASYRAAVAGILTSPVFADELNRQAALYGYATEIGASRADGFDPTWQPAARI